MKKFYIIRHGECVANTLKLASTWFDDALTAKGKEQAKEAIETVKPLGISMIYCSTLMRARQTADILNSELKVPITFSDDIREKNYGPYMVGLTTMELADIAETENRLKGREYSFDFRPYYGDSIVDVVRRLEKAILEIREHIAKGETVLAVSHSGIIRILLKLYNNESAPQNKSLPNAAVHEFDLDQEVDWHMFDASVPETFEYLPPHSPSCR